MRALIRGLWLAVLLAGCAHAPPAPAGMLVAPDLPARLYCVAYDERAACAIYRSAQPTAAEFAGLVSRFGIRSVVKLNFDVEGRDELPDGVDRFDHAWLPAGPVSHTQVLETLAAIEIAPKPVLIHCTRGINRTGLLLSLYRVKHGSLPFAAHAEWVAYGQDDTAFPLLLTAFERETARDP